MKHRKPREEELLDRDEYPYGEETWTEEAELEHLIWYAHKGLCRARTLILAGEKVG